MVGCVPEHEGRILLCKRAIEPRLGYWTVPAGFMENGETLEAGAARESWEEALARVEIGSLLAVVSVVHAHQVHVMFRARLPEPAFGAGPESLEVGLYRPETTSRGRRSPSRASISRCAATSTTGRAASPACTSRTSTDPPGRAASRPRRPRIECPLPRAAPRARRVATTTQPRVIMTFVVTENCIKCKYMDCVEVCPVDCFHEGPNFLVIDPDECIDCTLCEPECPAEAIYSEEEIPKGQEQFLKLNAELAKTWPVISEMKPAPADADEWKGRPGKLSLLER